MPRVGHFDLVPPHPTWIGGLRAYCKTVEKALRLYQGANPLELAGAFAVETECVPADMPTETRRRTGPINFPIGLGSSGGVQLVFMEDICGENETQPRHAKVHTTLCNMRAGIEVERIRALKSWRNTGHSGAFPAPQSTIAVNPDELGHFRDKLERLGECPAKGQSDDRCPTTPDRQGLEPAPRTAAGKFAALPVASAASRHRTLVGARSTTPPPTSRVSWPRTIRRCARRSTARPPDSAHKSSSSPRRTS